MTPFSILVLKYLEYFHSSQQTQIKYRRAIDVEITTLSQLDFISMSIVAVCVCWVSNYSY